MGCKQVNKGLNAFYAPIKLANEKAAFSIAAFSWHLLGDLQS
jgi:hypothetical protein